ncbi:hypothetical protein [Pseudoalteromonas sp. 5-MNA-CIBAN-0065]|uniref:hypothetical protein n=1 Tax=Pseudoalteromonas sp. 5-MNA-CIBAN-0065 TaxID=3140421 RepID=UPI003330A31B
MLVPFSIWGTDELAKIAVFGGSSGLHKNLEYLYIKIRNNIEGENSEAVSNFLRNAYRALTCSYTIPTNDISKFYDSSELNTACSILKENFPSIKIELEKFTYLINRTESKPSFALMMLEKLTLENDQFSNEKTALLVPKSNIDQINNELNDVGFTGYFQLLEKKSYFDTGFNEELIFLGPVNWFKQYLKLPCCKKISVLQPIWYQKKLQLPNLFEESENHIVGMDLSISEVEFTTVFLNDDLPTDFFDEADERLLTQEPELNSPYTNFKSQKDNRLLHYILELSTGFFNLDNTKNQYFISNSEAHELNLSSIDKVRDDDYVIQLIATRELDKFITSEKVSWEEEMEEWKAPLRAYSQFNILERKLKSLGADSEAIECNIKTWMKPAKSTLNAPRSDSNLKAVLTLAGIDIVFHDYYIDLVSEIRVCNRLQGRVNSRTRKSYVLNTITKWFNENTITNETSEIEAEFGLLKIDKVKVVHIEPY